MTLRRRLTLLFLVLAQNVLLAEGTEWSLSLNNGAGTWTASETRHSVSLAGTLVRVNSGFAKLTVTSSSGSYAPAVNSVRHLVELPGMVTILQPMLTVETELIYLVTAGSCPTTSQNSIWIFGHWDRDGANDMTSAIQPAFGSATYTPGSPATFTLNQIYEVNSGAAIAGFSSFNLTGNCSSGTVSISGAGDRGGTVYVTSSGGTFFRTFGNKGVLAIPQVRLSSSPNTYTGSYSGFRYTSSTSPDIKPMRMTVTQWGYDAEGNALSDVENGTVDPSFSETLNIWEMNAPVNGMIRGRIVRSAQTGNVSCAAYAGSRTVLFCAGQSPDANAVPFNLVLVSDQLRFTKGVGISGGAFSYPGSTDTGARVNDIIHDVAANKTYLAGRFTSYAGSEVRHLIRLNSDSSRDSGFTAYFDDDVQIEAIAEAPDASGDLYVTGTFTQLLGTSRERILRLNSDGTLDTAFNPGSGLVGGGVYDVSAATDGSNTIYVGGDFTSYNGTGTDAFHLVRITSTGALDSTFATGTGPSGGVNYPHVHRVIPMSDGTVYIGGDFSGFNGVSNKNGLLRLTSLGAIDSAFDVGATGFNDEVESLAPALDGSGDIYVGGRFTSYNGTSTNATRIARLNSDGSLDNGFATGAGVIPYSYVTVPEVWDIEVVPTGTGGYTADDVYVMGFFTRASGLDYTRMVRYNNNGSVDTLFEDPNFFHDPVVGTIAGTTGDLWAGGQLVSGISGRGVRGVAKINTLGSFEVDSFTQFGAGGFDKSVRWHGIAPANDGTSSIYVVGDFDSYNSATAPRLVRLTENGTVDNSFDVSQNIWGDGPKSDELGTGQVAVTPDGQKIYVTGVWTSNVQNNVTTSVGYIARYHRDGSFDTTFGTGTGFNFRMNGALPLADGDVIVHGAHTDYNGTSSNGLIRLNSNGSIDSAFAVGTGFAGTTLEVTDVQPAADGSGDFYVSGIFDTYQGQNFKNLIRINSDASIDSAFDVGAGLNDEGWVNLPLSNGQVYVAGGFTTYRGSSVGMIIRINSNGTLDSTFDTSPSGGFNYLPSTIALANDGSGDIYAGGYFSEYRGSRAGRIVRLNSDGTRDASFVSGEGFSSYVNVILSVPNNTTGQVYVGGDFGSYDGYGADYIARLRSNGQTD